MELKEFMTTFSSSDTIALLLTILLSIYCLLLMLLFYVKTVKNKNRILSSFLDKKINMNEAQFLFSKFSGDIARLNKINIERLNKINIERLNKINKEINKKSEQFNKLDLKNDNEYSDFLGFYEVFKPIYSREEKQCNFFRISLVVTIILFVILILSAKDMLLIEELNIPSIINRFLIVLPFMYLIVYFSKEASRHRKSMIINRQKYLDLNILDDYIIDLPRDKQIELRVKLLEHFFNHKEFDYKCEPLISKEFIETLKILQKTLNFEDEKLNKVKKIKDKLTNKD